MKHNTAINSFSNGSLSDTYYLLLQNSFPVFDRNSSISITDESCLWFKNIQLPPLNGKLYIKFKTNEYVIGNWN